MRGEKEPLGRNAKTDESLYCLSGFDFDYDRYDLAHQHYHLKSGICDDLLGLVWSSASTIDVVCGQQARRGSCSGEWRFQNHHKLVAASMVDGPY
jgi:hypothetical protein